MLDRDGDVEVGSVEGLRPGGPVLAGGFLVAADMAAVRRRCYTRSLEWCCDFCGWENKVRDSRKQFQISCSYKWNSGLARLELSIVNVILIVKMSKSAAMRGVVIDSNNVSFGRVDNSRADE